METLVEVPARNAAALDGACAYAAGSHACSGKTAAFNPMPSTTNTTPAATVRVCDTSPILTERSAMFRVPVIM